MFLRGHRCLSPVFILPGADTLTGLEAELAQPAWRSWVGLEQGFGDDVLRYSLYGSPFFDILLLDSLYAQAPVLKLTQQIGWDLVITLRQENRQVYQNAFGLLRASSPDVCWEHREEGRTREARMWDSEGLLFTAGHPQPVRVLRAGEHVTAAHCREGQSLGHFRPLSHPSMRSSCPPASPSTCRHLVVLQCGDRTCEIGSRPNGRRAVPAPRPGRLRRRKEPHHSQRQHRRPAFMKILLYNPDNGVTRNFMPHLWMFLLQALTPPGHEVLLIDGNAKPMSDADLVRLVLDEDIRLVGIGAMTRMIAKAYRVADALRTAGVPVVMGGPHVTAMPDEALGRDGGPRHADAVALGEADETWPRIVEDAARGALREVYATVDACGQPRKPDLHNYPQIPWDSLDLDQFNRIPNLFRPLMQHFRTGWETFHIIPIESGRGCPYGCDFCTVTGFFGDSIRFRSNQSIVEEMLRLKARARRGRGEIAVFFVDDNFAIDIRRAKSLLRDIIAAGAQLSWVGQVSANLLRDEELVGLIAESGGRWVFIGMESIDPANLASVHKGFSKPVEYGAVLERLARRNVYAIASFIFGLDHDVAGVAERTLRQIRTWPPVLPVFGQITPFPGTPLYERLAQEGRLTRPRHWLEFAPFQMAHTPLKMAIPEVQSEVTRAWRDSYSPAATRAAMEALRGEPVPYRISHLAARLFFRGIYFPQKGVWGWLKVVAQNGRAIIGVIRDAFRHWPAGAPARTSPAAPAAPQQPVAASISVEALPQRAAE